MTLTCADCGSVFERKSRGVIPSRCGVCAERRQSSRKGIRRAGMSLEEYNILIIKQGGVCAICGEVPGKKRLAIDHDHKCCPAGKSCVKCVRGLLCENCNRGLGMFKDSPSILCRAREYLSASL